MAERLQAIPKHWLDRLEMREVIDRIANDLDAVSRGGIQFEQIREAYPPNWTRRRPINLGLRLQDQLDHVGPLDHQPGVRRSPAEVRGHVVEPFPQLYQSEFQRFDSLSGVQTHAQWSACREAR